MVERLWVKHVRLSQYAVDIFVISANKQQKTRNGIRSSQVNIELFCESKYQKAQCQLNVSGPHILISDSNYHMPPSYCDVVFNTVAQKTF